MSEYMGYESKSLAFLKENKIRIGDYVKILADLTYSGRLMPRYGSSDDKHIVLKLKSGYNVGLEISKIKKVELIQEKESTIKPPVQKIEKNESLPKIRLLSTGGTIASKVDYRTGGVTSALSAEDLNASVPELSEIANIDAEVLFSEYSENLTPDHWKKIAERLDSLVNNSEYQGIIIAHGTDTMHYTASFLSFALAGYPIPIALVGSQRSSDRPSSDATLNLIAAANFVVGCNTTGVFVIMHSNESDDVISCHVGTRIRKSHTSKRGAFQTIGGNPAFLVVGKKIENNHKEKFFKNENYKPKIKLDTRVALIKYHPGYDPKLIDNIIESGYKAIIFEGTGLGHIGKTMYDHVKKANKKGLFLGMTSQCVVGRVNMNVYESGRDLVNFGVTPLSDIIPETALVKAMWALGNSENNEEMKNLMLENIASEFSD